MDDVARKANVSKRTLYDFFKDKESLLIGALNKIREPYTEYIASTEDKSATALDVILLLNEKIMERQIWLCNAFFEDIKRYPEALRFMINAKMQFLNMVADLLKRGEKESVFMSDINYEIISIVVHTQFRKNESLDMAELFTRYTHEEVHNTLFFIFLRGICTDLGRDILNKFVAKKQHRKNSIHGQGIS